VLTPDILRQTYNADMVVLRQDGMTFIANRSLAHPHVPQQGMLAHRPRRVPDGVLR